MTAVAMAAAPAAVAMMPAKQNQYPARPRPQSWPETGQGRAALEQRLSSPPFLPASAEVRRSMRRGLTSLLDWLEQQPGQAWQDRWLASGAEAAGPAWTDLVLFTGVRGKQIAGRCVLVSTGAYPCDAEWKGLAATLESALRLHRHEPGSLTRSARYLHRRTGGMIGSLSHLVRAAESGRHGAA